MLEIEIRGKFDKSKFEKLKLFLTNNAKLKDSYERLSVDLSLGFDETTRSWKNSKFDLRVKKSGENEKISLKVGSFDLKTRKEIDLKLQQGEFLNALELLNIMGFDKGMIYFWESWEYEYNGFEVKISKYTDDYFTWEIESNTTKNDPNNLAKEFGLVPYTKVEYGEAIEWENQNIHLIYSFESVKRMLTK